jgi:hypothetical protein
MYLWKYWRESRITFAVGMVLVGLLLWGVLKIPVGSVGGDIHDHSGNSAGIYLVAAAILTFPLAFLGWQFGTFGVGHDLSWGSGGFLFSRPRSRAFFVWSDWGYGMAQLLLLVLAANSVLALACCRDARDGGPILLSGEPVSMFSIFCLHCAGGLLFTGLLFGLTYFCSVLVKRRGLVLSIGVVLAYLIAKAVVNYCWQITLPDLTLTEFTMKLTGGASFADHLGLEIALRSAVALAFPVAAQLLLQQRDID